MATEHGHWSVVKLDIVGQWEGGDTAASHAVIPG